MSEPMTVRLDRTAFCRVNAGRSIWRRRRATSEVTVSSTSGSGHLTFPGSCQLCFPSINHGAPEAALRSETSDPLESRGEPATSRRPSSGMADVEKRDDLRRPTLSDDHVRLHSRKRSPESRTASRRFTEMNERRRGSDEGAFSGRPPAKEHTEPRPSDVRTVSQDRRERNDSDYRSRSRREDDDERQRRNRGRNDPALPSISAYDERRSRDRWPRDRDTSYRSDRYTPGRRWEGKSGGMSEEGEFKRPRGEESKREQRGSEVRGEGRRSESGSVPWMVEPQVDKRVPPRGEWGAKGGGSSDGFGGKWGHDMFHEVNRSPEKKVEEISMERIEALLAA